MSAPGTDLTAQVAAHLRSRVAPPWEIFAQRLRRHEIHLVGRRIELVRGPIELEGFGLRVLRSAAGTTKVGVASTNDLETESIDRVIALAESAAQFSEFPAASVELPGPAPGPAAPTTTDPRIRDTPQKSISVFTDDLLRGFDGVQDVVPSFGSIRVTYTENAIANSAGLDVQWAGTQAELEFAVKANGGPEGAAPSEYWVNRTARQLDPKALGVGVARWCQVARDMRGAGPPTSGDLNLVIPGEVLSDILPAVLGYRLTGAARLRKIAPDPGTTIASSEVTIHDNPLLPWGARSSPFDDEGVPRRSIVLLEHGTVQTCMYDLLHAAHFGASETGHAVRSWAATGSTPFRFPGAISPGASNLVVEPGAGGSDSELVEAAGDGIWLEQIGFPFPDPMGGTYGGEIRAGYRIRNGKLAEPIRGGTVGGFVLAGPKTPSLLSGIRCVGKTPEIIGSLSSPAVLAQGISVAGPA